MMDRREFLRKAGLSSIALGSLPALVNSLATPVWANGQTSFQFHAQNATGPAGTPAAPQHRLILGGAGTFDPSRPGSPVHGGGTYVHFLFPGANPSAGGTPLRVVSSGTWKARLVSYQQIGTWGVFAAGAVELAAELFQEIPSKVVIRGARLRILCNIGGAGLSTGEPEGYFLSILGTEFATGATPGPFAPLTPPVGVTVFNTVPIPA